MSIVHEIEPHARPRLVADDGGPLPEAGGVSDALVIERASATPLASTAGLESPVEAIDVGGAAGPLPLPLPLRTLETWFQAVITHPVGVAEGVEAAAAILRSPSAEGDQLPVGPVRLEQLVTRGPKISAAGRMGVYHHAYHARLVECLADDYPVLQRALGEATFETLARRYIEAHPSTSPNLNGFGRRFSAFSAAEGQWLDDRQAFAADLARLEWAIVEVIHAPSAELFSLERLRAVPPERWPQIRLTPSPTLRFHEFDFPANRYLQAARTSTTLPSWPEAAWSATAVYRQGFGIWRMDFTRPMAGVLRALLAAATLGDALATLEESPAESLEGDVMAWFRAWVEGGFFQDVVL